MISFSKKLSTKFIFLVNNSNFLDIIKRSACLLCGETNYNKSRVCTACTKDLSWNHRFCSKCAFPLVAGRGSLENTNTIVCGECLTHPPSFTLSIIPFTYTFPVKALIQRVKYNKEQYWMRSLSVHFKDYLLTQCREPSLPDILIAVPLHKNKQKLRGFNQSEILSKHLSKLLKIPTQKNLLIKIKESSDQASLKKSERLRNLRNCFIVTDTSQIEGKHIALIDDVMTTKATSEICSRVLLDHGARRVDIWCLARTPKEKTF